MSGSKGRDVAKVEAPSCADRSTGRNLIAVIGVDRYRHWRRLSNAVRDAIGAWELFQEVGFEHAVQPMLDEAATFNAMWSLVTEDLKSLGRDDSLVLFYAGHGATQIHDLGNDVVRTGHLVPVEAEDRVSTWIDLEGWLRAVALLPAKHILVILDACHSGLALSPVMKWRDTASWRNEPLATLRARRSRRIITSALDNQIALDSGPAHGHSLFTGCLIEALRHGIPDNGSDVTTGSELAVHLQQRVANYPHSQQTPDFGTFAFDDRGEMVIPLLAIPDRSPAGHLRRYIETNDIENIKKWLSKDTAVLDAMFPHGGWMKTRDGFSIGSLTYHWKTSDGFLWADRRFPSVYSFRAVMLGPVAIEPPRVFASELHRFFEFMDDKRDYYRRKGERIPLTPTLLIGRRNEPAEVHRSTAIRLWKEWQQDHRRHSELEIRSYDGVLDACTSLYAQSRLQRG